MKIPAPVFYFRRNAFHREPNLDKQPKWHLMLMGDNEELPKTSLTRYIAICGYRTSGILNGIMVRKVIRSRGLTCKICLKKYKAAGG